MEAILKIQDIDKSFALRGQRMKVRNGQESIKVIEKLSLDIWRGMISALIGGNGAGKTTLFNIISGLLRPDEGEIIYFPDNERVSLINRAPHEISRMGVGRMFQGTRIFSELTIGENLMLFITGRDIEMPIRNIFKSRSVQAYLKLRESKLHETLDNIMGADNWVRPVLCRKAGSVSFAEQRLLSLIGMIIGRYNFVLLDEPTSGIEAEYLPMIRDWILRLKEEGTTVFLIEHNMEFVRDIADHCHFMASGRILHSGQPETVLSHPDVRKSYLI